MGIDVEFKARPTAPLTDAEVADLRARFIEATPLEHDFGDRRYPDLAWDEYEDTPTLEIRTLTRYYGVGYERGHWPDIRAMCDWLAEALDGQAEFRYGGDCDSGWDELRPWAEVRAECEAHWTGFGNEPYRAAFRRG